MIHKKNDVILVPWDFTEVAEYAFQHAVVVRNSAKSDIKLVHIVKSEKEVEAAKQKVEKACSDLEAKFKYKPEVIVKAGSIFTSISDVATETEANLVIMGTHGIKGMQKLTGSWALKVIVSSDIPFIVVQSPPQKDQMENIVFPVDFRVETREKLNWVHYLSKYYKVKINIFKRTDSALKKKVEGNIQFAKKYLQQHNIDYSINTENGKDSFAKETIEFAQSKNADLVLIMTNKNMNFTDYIMGPDEQSIIANSAKIPVMCINPRPVQISGSFSASGG